MNIMKKDIQKIVYVLHPQIELYDITINTLHITIITLLIVGNSSYLIAEYEAIIIIDNEETIFKLLNLRSRCGAG